MQICNKVVRYDPNSAQVSETRFLGREILDPSTMIQRLFVRWANGVRYSYPGTYDDPRNPAFERRWDTFAEPSDQKKILWSAPYEAPLSALRVTCRYPMFARNGDFLGVAGLELRLECLLAPLIQAHNADPIHELYLLDHEESVVTVRNGKLVLLGDNAAADGMPSAGEIRAIAGELADSNMAQFEKRIGSRIYYVSGYRIRTTGAILIQMIEKNAMANHDHKDISL